MSAAAAAFAESGHWGSPPATNGQTVQRFHHVTLPACRGPNVRSFTVLGAGRHYDYFRAKDTGRNKCAYCCGDRIAYVKRIRKDRFSYSAKCPNTTISANSAVSLSAN
jgi:hypothetical protein